MITFRAASEADIPSIINLLSDDPLGTTRENPTVQDLTPYAAAFEEINQSPDNHLLVMCDGPLIVGTFQLTFIRNMTYQGGLRAQIEGVRIAKDQQGHHYGTLMLEHAIDMARNRGAHMVQLTTNKLRPEAIQFYQKLGFEASHEGFKMLLD